MALARHLPSRRNLLPAFAIGAAAIDQGVSRLRGEPHHRGGEYTWRKHLACCGIAALSAAGALLFRDPWWTRSPARPRLPVAVLRGSLLARFVLLPHVTLVWSLSRGWRDRTVARVESVGANSVGER